MSTRGLERVVIAALFGGFLGFRGEVSPQLLQQLLLLYVVESTAAVDMVVCEKS
jgi:hypothetical protein